MKLKLVFISLFTLGFIVLNAGTIVYRTEAKGKRHTLSKVKIVSIDKTLITIKHDGGIRTIPLSYIVNYYDTDIDTSNFADTTARYEITIQEIKMPGSGYAYVRNKKTKKKSKKTSNCEIKFSINKKLKDAKSKNIRMPYFYLFVLTTSSEAFGSLPVYSYYYPKSAKIRSKTYDEAKIIEAVRSMKRPYLYHDGKSHLGKSIGKLDSAGGFPPILIPLKKIKNKKIIAYHLEIWGKDRIIGTKNWHNMKYTVGKRWWKRY